MSDSGSHTGADLCLAHVIHTEEVEDQADALAFHVLLRLNDALPRN